MKFGENLYNLRKAAKMSQEKFHCKINDLVHENMVDIDSLDEDIKMSVVKFKEEKQKKIKGISKAIYIIARIGN